MTEDKARQLYEEYQHRQSQDYQTSLLDDDNRLKYEDALRNDPYPEYQNDIRAVQVQAAYAKQHGQTAQLKELIRLIEYLLAQAEVQP